MAGVRRSPPRGLEGWCTTLLSSAIAQNDSMGIFENEGGAPPFSSVVLKWVRPNFTPKSLPVTSLVTMLVTGLVTVVNL